MRRLVALTALCLAQPALAAEGELALGSGLSYSSGTYGGSSYTHIWTIPLTARYDNGPWTFKAVVPYLRITGPRAVVPGVGRVENGNVLSDLLGLPVNQRRERAQNELRTV